MNRRLKRRKKRKAEITGEGNNEIKKRKGMKTVSSASAPVSQRRKSVSVIDLYLEPQCLSQKTKADSITKTNSGDRSRTEAGKVFL